MNSATKHEVNSTAGDSPRERQKTQHIANVDYFVTHTASVAPTDNEAENAVSPTKSAPQSLFQASTAAYVMDIDQSPDFELSSPSAKTPSRLDKIPVELRLAIFNYGTAETQPCEPQPQAPLSPLEQNYKYIIRKVAGKRIKQPLEKERPKNLCMTTTLSLVCRQFANELYHENMYAKNNEFLFKDPKFFLRFFDRTDTAKTDAIQSITLHFPAADYKPLIVEKVYRKLRDRPETSNLKHLTLSFLDDQDSWDRYMVSHQSDQFPLPRSEHVKRGNRSRNFHQLTLLRHLGLVRGLKTFELKGLVVEADQLLAGLSGPDDVLAMEIRLRDLVTRPRNTIGSFAEE